MSFSAHCKGIQHIGIPTRDIKKTIDFYGRLGFEVAWKTGFEEGGTPVAFLKQGNLVIETYQDGPFADKAGIVDHFCIDVDDIEAVYDLAVKGGFKVITNGIEQLPFWANGVRFFKIEGPNGEAIEYGQIL